MMAKNKLFWVCQWTGWSFVVFINFLIQLLQKDVRLASEIYSNTIFLLAGVLITWCLRLIYQKLNIFEFSPLKLIAPVFFLSLISSVTVIFISFSSIAIYNSITGFEEDVFTVNMWTGNLIGILPILAMWSLLYFAINYLLRWRQSEIDKISLSGALKEAQLNTLIGQVNPHFMFNSLNNIRSLMLEDVDKARDMLTLLSKVLRYSLTSHKKQFISLQQELSILQDFIDLSAIHLEERLQYQPDICCNNLDIKVPPMIIQMLIENAIKHGISEVKGGGQLKLLINQDESNLIIVVTNPGSLSGTTTNISTGLGLENIRKRLLLLYNGRASLSIKEENNQVDATMILPISE